MKFEYLDFCYLKKLIERLDYVDSETLEVSCFGVSEFIKLHPFGAMMIDKLGAKEKIVELTKNKEGKVSIYALNAFQNFMIKTLKH